MSEKELIQRIQTKREEAKKAGRIHYRDLMREIHRLEKELRTYRCYRQAYEKGQRVPA